MAAATAVNTIAAPRSAPRHARGGSGNEYASQTTHIDTHTVDSENSGASQADEW